MCLAKATRSKTKKYQQLSKSNYGKNILYCSKTMHTLTKQRKPKYE